MRTLKLVVAYDGTHYCGWQRQKNGPTIQQELEQALSVICNDFTAVHGAGRTDAGVHAIGMTAHFKTPSRVSSRTILKGLNSLLPGAIQIISVEEKDDTFHARFSAVSKTYRYSVFTGEIQNPLRRLYTLHYPYNLHAEAMKHCLEIVTGTHDFAAFETSGSRDKQAVNTRGAVRTVLKTELKNPEPDLFHLLFTGDGFLRHMVRNLSGTILEVGRGKREPTEFREILTSRDRQQAGATAPAHGLTLISVHY